MIGEIVDKDVKLESFEMDSGEKCFKVFCPNCMRNVLIRTVLEDHFLIAKKNGKYQLGCVRNG